MYKLVYHGAVLSKKNQKRAIRNGRTGRLGVVMTPAARANQEEIIRQFWIQRPSSKILAPLSVEIEIFEPDFKRRDLDNQATSIMDALTRAGIIEDDGIKVVREMRVKFAGVDKKDPRAEVIIKESR